MPERTPPSIEDVEDLEILLRAHHPLIVLETDEPERAHMLTSWVADRLGLPFVSWTPDRGLQRPDVASFAVDGSVDPGKALDHVLNARTEMLYFLRGFAGKLDDESVVDKLVEVSQRLFAHRGAVLIAMHQADLPRPLARVATVLRLSAPSPEQYYQFVKRLLDDLRKRMPVRVRLNGDEVARLIAQLQGLTLFEVKKVLTKAIVEDGAFTAEDIPKIAEAKKEIVARSGVLEYYAADESMTEIAGLASLKGWLAKRKLAFTHPSKAKEFGLSPPRGVLLIGVQGCGKSMCAKAIAKEWGLPLIRLDPSNLYNKFFGESEKNLRRATRTAESMAPIVLWIDEMEKAFAQGDDSDSGTSSRIFGSFLTWMQDKKDGVFVVATSNDISRLPAELLRKGRFDEIFFVDLPPQAVRETILAVHLRRRGRNPVEFPIGELAARMEGWSGAEIEQVVLSALYSAFSAQEPLAAAHIMQEITRSVPLSVTASETIDKLRAWAKARAVPAD